MGKTPPKAKDLSLNPDIRLPIKKGTTAGTRSAVKEQNRLKCSGCYSDDAEVKEKSWIEFLDELEDDPDTTKVWRTIRSMSGNPDSPGPNGALLHNGKLITINLPT